MEFIKTAKIQIHPQADDIQLLLDSTRAYAKACCFVSEYVFASHDLSQVSVQKHTYTEIRDKYNLPSQMACNVVRTVIGSYKANKTNGADWTFCKYNAPQMTLSWNRDYSINKDKFSVGTLNGRIKCDYDIKGMERYFDKSKYTFGTAKVIYKHGVRAG